MLGRGSLTWTDFCQGFLWMYTAGASVPDLLDERCPHTPLPSADSPGGKRGRGDQQDDAQLGLAAAPGPGDQEDIQVR